MNAEHAREPLFRLIFNGHISHAVAHLPAARRALDGLNLRLEVVPGNHDEASPAQWLAAWGVPVNLIARYGDVALVLVTTSDQAGEYLCPDRDWLVDALAQVADARAVFLALHVPERRLSRRGVACDGLLELELGTANLRAVLHGHDHDLSDVVSTDGLPFVFGGHAGGHWGTPQRTFRVVGAWCRRRAAHHPGGRRPARAERHAGSQRG